MRARAAFLAAAALLGGGAAAFAADVVVLRGGARIELKGPVLLQGDKALLTRADGTLLSVPFSEIDRAATAAAKAASSAPPPAPAVAAVPASPAEAARASRERPKARVRLTDSDVGHPIEIPSPSSEKYEEALAGAARLEILDYAQDRAGDQLVVRGSLRNAGGTTALSSRLTISALNDKGETIVSAEAGISNGTIEAHRSVSFSASLPIGEQPVASFRFSPRWVAAPPPAPAGGGAGEGAAPGAAGGQPAAPGQPASTRAAAPPAPPPTPYGLGSLYAGPAPSASFTPPADGKSGYIPGAASPDNQPKPPQ